MSIGRNDPCPCGSGKKYKKCCLKKDTANQLTTIQKEQFHQQKHVLFSKLRHFVDEYTTFEQFHQLKIEFKQRTKGQVVKEEEEGFFIYWLYFVYRFSNGLRLIEWFYEENAQRLSNEERNRIKEWTSLQPRLLQAIEHSKSEVYFQDMLSGEIFPLIREAENIPFFIPWMSTLGVVEPYEDTFYFNGIRPNGSPNDMKRAIKRVNELADVNKETKEKILIDFYPEILAEFLKKDYHLDKKEEEVVEYTSTYKIKNEDVVSEYLRTLPHLQINEWTDENKELVWVGNHRIYEDNAIEKEIEIADVYGQIVIENDQLQYKSLDQQHLDELKKMTQEVQENLFFDVEGKRVIGSSSEAAKNVMISVPEGIPEYISHYAQSDLMQEIAQPQSQFNQQSIRDLIKNNQKFDVEMWLRQSEYGMFRTVLERFNTIDITADFNTIRKELGMPLSPFVTGGSSRKTNVKYVEYDKSGHDLLEKKLPILESLGFTPDSLNRFYTIDFIYFYEDKTADQTAAAIEKYRKSLFDLREIMQQKSITSWEECGVSFWRSIIMVDYPNLHNETDQTAKDDFLFTVRELLGWLDENSGTSQFYKSLLFIENWKE